MFLEDRGMKGRRPRNERQAAEKVKADRLQVKQHAETKRRMEISRVHNTYNNNIAAIYFHLPLRN